MQAGAAGAVGAGREQRDHLAGRDLRALRHQRADRFVGRAQATREGQGEDPAARDRAGPVDPAGAHRTHLRAHRGRQVHPAVPRRVRGRGRVPPPEHRQGRGEGTARAREPRSHPCFRRPGSAERGVRRQWRQRQGQYQHEQELRHAAQGPAPHRDRARGCGRAGGCGQSRHPAYRRVPYTSCGDPGHRVDFARPSTDLSGRVKASLGPLLRGQGATRGVRNQTEKTRRWPWPS